jgi:hypothetical protein
MKSKITEKRIPNCEDFSEIQWMVRKKNDMSYWGVSIEKYFCWENLWFGHKLIEWKFTNYLTALFLTLW